MHEPSLVGEGGGEHVAVLADVEAFVHGALEDRVGGQSLDARALEEDEAGVLEGAGELAAKFFTSMSLESSEASGSSADGSEGGEAPGSPSASSTFSFFAFGPSGAAETSPAGGGESSRLVAGAAGGSSAMGWGASGTIEGSVFSVLGGRDRANGKTLKKLCPTGGATEAPS